MKRTVNKLRLTRETLVDLNRTDLRSPAGGFSPRTICLDICLYSNGQVTCTTCDSACTTNRC